MKWPFQKVYLAGYVLIAASMPLSMFGMSVGILVLLGNWLLEGNFSNKYRLARENPSLWLIVSVYLVHLLWLLHSTDLHYGLQDVRIKLPLVVLPLIVATSSPPGRRGMKIIIGCFILALLVSSAITVSILAGWYPYPITDARQTSLFISHIRLALMANLGLFAAAWYLFRQDEPVYRYERYYYTFSLTGLLLFVFLLKSLTGIVVLFILILFTLGWMAAKHRRWRHLLFLLTSLLILILAGYLVYAVDRFYRIDNLNPAQLATHTAAGNPYTNHTDQAIVENGHYVWIYICEPELRKAWNKRSRLPYDGMDAKQQGLRYTLIRYLASRGLRKDAEGVARLSENDIHHIEAGMANYLYADRWRLYPYVYRVIWEIDVYRKGDNPSGHSVTQRFVYLLAAMNIIRGHLFTGVGTGDVQKAFDAQYAGNFSYMAAEWRKRAHNQFVTFCISFGIIGAAWIIFALYLPVIRNGPRAGYLAWVFILIITLSMMNEDTLETHAGVTFFSFFYALFFIRKPDEAGS